MVRENTTAKAGRHLKEGRVILNAVAPGHVTAIARGDRRLYRVTYQHPHWSCTCPARRRCSHLIAVRRVVAVDIDGTGTNTGPSPRSRVSGRTTGNTASAPTPPPTTTDNPHPTTPPHPQVGEYPHHANTNPPPQDPASLPFSSTGTARVFSRRKEV